jgi:hypothetical protein
VNNYVQETSSLKINYTVPYASTSQPITTLFSVILNIMYSIPKLKIKNGQRFQNATVLLTSISWMLLPDEKRSANYKYGQFQFPFNP